MFNGSFSFYIFIVATLIHHYPYNMIYVLMEDKYRILNTLNSKMENF